MSFTHALKKIFPVFAVTLLVAFAAHATPAPAPTPTAPAQPSPVTFAIAPVSPTVYFSDYPFSNGTAITAPWFKFVPSMVNNSGRIITVMSMRVDMIFYRNGVAYSDSMDVNLNSWGGIFQSLPGKPLAAEDYFVGTLQPADSSVYAVTLHLDGWYGTVNSPEDRFHMDYSFSTK